MPGTDLIFIYSKFSTSSREIYNVIDNNIQLINSFFNIKIFCIDNENIRKKVLSSKTLEIRIVPTILLIFVTGKIEKFEGEMVFLWLNNLLSSFKPKEMPPPQENVRSNNTSQNNTSVENLTTEDNDESLEQNNIQPSPEEQQEEVTRNKTIQKDITKLKS